MEAVFRAMVQAVPEAVTAGFSRRLRYAITGEDPIMGGGLSGTSSSGEGEGEHLAGLMGGQTWERSTWPGESGAQVWRSLRSVSPSSYRATNCCRTRAGMGGGGEGSGAWWSWCMRGRPGPGLIRRRRDSECTIRASRGSPGWAHRYSILSNGSERVLHSKETGVPVKPGGHHSLLRGRGRGIRRSDATRQKK